jgi:hypothetical protein
MVRWHTSRFWSVIALFCALLIPGTSITAHAQTQTLQPAAPNAILGKPTGKLSPRLQALAQYTSLHAASADTQARILSVAASGPGSLRKDAQGRLLVYIRTSDLSDANLNALRRAGALIEHVSSEYQVVTAFMPAAGLNALAAIDSVQYVYEVLQPFVQGSALAKPGQRANIPTACNVVVTEGDSQLYASAARSAYTVSGSAIKVGLLSDSFDQYSGAVTRAISDVQTGDLPGPGSCGIAAGNIAPTVVLSTQVNSLSIGLTDEGRAMAQIVHDLAPGAQLAFASAYNGLPEFADNIRALRTWGADIIVDDVYYLEEPAFQDGPVAKAIADVVGGGAIYFTSAGNHNIMTVAGTTNISSYESAAYRPVDRTVCPAVLPSYELTCHNFNSQGVATPYNQVMLDKGGRLVIDLQWNEPWNGVTTDLDLYLLDSHNVVTASSESSNIAFQQPYEYLDYTNNTGSVQPLRIVIGRSDGTALPRLKYFFLQGTRGVLSVQFATNTVSDTIGPSLFGHSASRYVNSVAAVPFDGNATPEPFSSHGPAWHYWGPVAGTTAASSITPDLLRQPDFTATDGGRTTFFSTQYSGVWRFFGTSAAAPHAAGVAALVLQQARRQSVTLNNAAMNLALKASASPMSGGDINSVGSGRLNALLAMRFINPRRVYMPAISR